MADPMGATARMGSAARFDASLREYVQSKRVGHLATVDPTQRPSVVPICFALLDDGKTPVIVSALDEKPKRVGPAALQRVRNIEANPEVMLVIDDYAEDWTRLRFVQLRGHARVLPPGDDVHRLAVAALRARYPQYAAMAIDARPVIMIADLVASAWRASEGEPGGPIPRAGAVDFAALVRGRRSVRSFSSQSVPRAAIEQAIAAAGWAPSPHGRQPWRFAVVEAAARREALARAMAATWEEQLLLDGQPAEVVARRLARSQERLHAAPILVVPCLYLADLDVYPDADRQQSEETMAIQSLGAAIQNFLLAIYAAGLEAGWMCAPLFCPDLVREQLGLADALIPHAMIPVGYAAHEPVRRERLPLASLIATWE